MQESRTFRSLCCFTQATLLNACADEQDLRELGFWREGPNRAGFSPGLWARVSLHKASHADERVAARIADRLDLQFVDTVVLVRCMTEDELEVMVDLWAEEPVGEVLPALLWALSTDARDAVHRLGNRLCHEASVAAFQAFSAPAE